MDPSRGYEWFVCNFCREAAFPQRSQLLIHKKEKHLQDFVMQALEKQLKARFKSSRSQEVIDLCEEERGQVDASANEGNARGTEGNQVVGNQKLQTPHSIVNGAPQMGPTQIRGNEPRPGPSSDVDVLNLVASQLKDEPGAGKEKQNSGEMDGEKAKSVSNDSNNNRETLVGMESSRAVESDRDGRAGPSTSMDTSCDGPLNLVIRETVDLESQPATPASEATQTTLTSSGSNVNLTRKNTEETRQPTSDEESEPSGTSNDEDEEQSPDQSRRSSTAARKKRRSNTKPWYDKTKPTKTKARNSGNKKFRCRKCRRQVFPTGADLRKHEKEVHERQEPLPCSECNRKFWCEDDLIAHMTKMHCKQTQQKDAKPYSCSECDASFSRLKTLRGHLRSVHDIEVGDEELDISTREEEGDAERTGRRDKSPDSVDVSKGRFLCRNCPAHFPSEITWKAHWDEVHKKRSGASETEEKAMGGEAVPRGAEANTSNGNSIRGIPTGTTLQASSPSGTSANPERSEADQVLQSKCPVCNLNFGYRIAVRSHIKKEHPEISLTESQFASAMELVYTAKKGLTDTTQIIEGNKKASRGDDKPFKCCKCSLSFSTRKEQVRHLEEDHHFSTNQVTELVTTGMDSNTATASTSKSLNTKLATRPQTAQDFNQIRCQVCDEYVKKSEMPQHITNHAKTTAPKPRAGPSVSLSLQHASGMAAARASSSEFSSSNSSVSSNSDSDNEHSLKKKEKVAEKSPRKPPKESVEYLCPKCPRKFAYNAWYRQHMLAVHGVECAKPSPKKRKRAPQPQKVECRKEPNTNPSHPIASTSSSIIQGVKLRCVLCSGTFHEEDALRKHILLNHRTKDSVADGFVQTAIEEAGLAKRSRSSSSDTTVPTKKRKDDNCSAKEAGGTGSKGTPKKTDASKTPSKESAAPRGSKDDPRNGRAGGNTSTEGRPPSHQKHSSSSSSRHEGSSSSHHARLPETSDNARRPPNGPREGLASRLASSTAHSSSRSGGEEEKLVSDHINPVITNYNVSNDLVNLTVSVPAHLLKSAMPDAANNLNCQILINKGLSVPTALYLGNKVKTEPGHGRRDYSCGYCRITYDSEEKLSNHLKSHQPKFECDLCPQVFSRQGWFIKHMEWHQNEQELKKLSSSHAVKNSGLQLPPPLFKEK